jgi:capsular exopolysaccharide synthesis family protein
LCRERGIKTLLITSANRQEGKSVICANLAMSLASIEGKKVLLIDMNLRQPTLHRFFEMKTRTNMVDALSRSKDIIPDATDIKNLSLISPTEEISEPSRLLASDALGQFMEKVKANYDYVIVDSPALIPYPDAANLSFESEGIILAVEFGKTRREVVERAKSVLDKSQRKILGTVLNKFEYVIPETLYKRL